MHHNKRDFAYTSVLFAGCTNPVFFLRVVLNRELLIFCAVYCTLRLEDTVSHIIFLFFQSSHKHWYRVSLHNQIAKFAWQLRQEPSPIWYWSQDFWWGEWFLLGSFSLHGELWMHDHFHIFSLTAGLNSAPHGVLTTSSIIWQQNTAFGLPKLMITEIIWQFPLRFAWQESTAVPFPLAEHLVPQVEPYSANRTYTCCNTK